MPSTDIEPATLQLQAWHSSQATPPRTSIGCSIEKYQMSKAQPALYTAITPNRF